MNTVYFVKAFCHDCGKDFYMRYDFAADDVWVRTYGIKEIPLGTNSDSLCNNGDFDISNSRVGPQYKCPWCGKKRFWRHTQCGAINCWDGKSNSVICGNCGASCTLGGGSVTSLKGTGNSGQ